jgi:phospholipid transport system transporter-binding protein
MASLRKRVDHGWELSGDLVIHTVPSVLNESRSIFTQGSETVVDLLHVERIDSAGLALLIEWMRVARQRQLSLRFQNIPGRMWAIAEVCGLEQILPRDAFQG